MPQVCGASLWGQLVANEACVATVILVEHDVCVASDLVNTMHVLQEILGKHDACVASDLGETQGAGQTMSRGLNQSSSIGGHSIQWMFAEQRSLLLPLYRLRPTGVDTTAGM